MTTEAAALDALAAVRDPELDEPITALGFVASLDVDGSSVAVRLRLPTYFCAPNFAWLMVADARAALAALPDVEQAHVSLDDHFASAEINAGDVGFDATFAGLGDGGGLDELRALFRRKAFVARQDRLCRDLLAAGRSVGELARMRLGDLPAGAHRDRYLERRAELGLPTESDAPLLVDAAGHPVPPEAAVTQLRRGRLTRVSIEGNADFCRGLLHTRYADPVRSRA